VVFVPCALTQTFGAATRAITNNIRNFSFIGFIGSFRLRFRLYDTRGHITLDGFFRFLLPKFDENPKSRTMYRLDPFLRVLESAQHEE
jgi:hypothetical protein